MCPVARGAVRSRLDAARHSVGVPKTVLDRCFSRCSAASTPPTGDAPGRDNGTSQFGTDRNLCRSATLAHSLARDAHAQL
jgi:hypothetical protein